MFPNLFLLFFSVSATTAVLSSQHLLHVWLILGSLVPSMSCRSLPPGRLFLIIYDGPSKSTTATVRSCLSIWSSKQHRPWRRGSHLSVKLTALFLFSVAFYCCWNYILLLDVNILRILLINFYLTCITKDWKMRQIMVNNSKLSWRKTVNLYMHWIFHLQNNVNANFQYYAALPFTFLVPRSVERHPFQQLVSGR